MYHVIKYQITSSKGKHHSKTGDGGNDRLLDLVFKTLECKLCKNRMHGEVSCLKEHSVKKVYIDKKNI